MTTWNCSLPNSLCAGSPAHIHAQIAPSFAVALHVRWNPHSSTGHAAALRLEVIKALFSTSTVIGDPDNTWSLHPAPVWWANAIPKLEWHLMMHRSKYALLVCEGHQMTTAATVAATASAKITG